MHTNMLLDEIKVCDVLVIKEVLFSCDRDNTASAWLIQKCGG